MIDPKELRELLLKCWMTHDGMWFNHCRLELGMAVANRLNKAANRSLAAIEAKRVMKAAGLEAVRSFEDLAALFEAMNQTVVGDFMGFAFSLGPENTLHCAMEGKCFALEGMRKMGVESEYECGIFNRVEGWFDALGLSWEVTPRILGCMLLDQGLCRRTYRFSF